MSQTDPDGAELLALIERLDADNERLRMKALELMRLMEEAVTAQVADERRVADLRRQVDLLEAEIAAIHRTKVMRATAGLRRLYGRMRRRAGG